MPFRFVTVAAAMLLALVTGPIAAAQGGAPAASPVRVDIVTEKGTITVELDTLRAPATSANFLRYADERRFDGSTFYRAMRLGFTTLPVGLIQGGLAGNPERVLPGIAHEPTSQTGILHKAGVISMARYAPGTAMGDFFILLSDMPELDADPANGDPNIGAGFAAFGHVVAGMDVVRAIHASELSPTEGEGAMKGQMLDPPVRIISVRRAAVIPAPASASGR